MAFVGREQELDRLERELALALNLSTGRSVFVQGAAGTGKTALVAEFVERVVVAQPGITVGRGRCLQTFGSADPYLPFVEALRDLSDETTAGFVKRETLSEMIAELTPYWLSAIPMVGNLLSASYATARKLGGASGSEAAPSREALFIQYLELLQGLAQQAPLILFLDDLQWADHSSIALLNHITRGLARQPVLVIGTVRSDEAEREKHPVTGLIRDLERESLGVGLNLVDLEEESFAELLRATFQGDVSEPLHRWVQSTAGSNPLFATELVRLLKESGAAREKHGEWYLTPSISDLPVPRSAEAVVEGRLQALDAEEIKLLQYASIEGTEFNSTVLAAMLEEDELDLLERLEKLDRRHHLVRTSGEVNLPDGDVATLLEFRHTLLQTVLYRQVVGKRRVLLHRKAGECLERIFPESADRIAGKLARHLHEGRVKDGAHRYACIAADAARRIYAHWEAEEYLKIAIQHSPDAAETVALLERLADVYFAVGYYEQASTALQSILDDHDTDARTALRLRRKLATVDRRLGSVAAPELLQRFRGLISEAEEVPEERCQLLLEVGFLPNAVGVVEGTEEAVEIAESLNDTWLLAKALDQLAWTLILGGKPRDGLTHLERAFSISGGANDPVRTARYYNISGVGYSKLGMYRDAYMAFEQMLATAERLAEPNHISVACSNMGGELLKLGEYDKAEEVLSRAFTIHQRRDRAYMLQSLFNLAKRAHWSGDFDTGFRRYSELVELATEIGYWTSEAVAHAGRGLILLETGRLEEARLAAAAAAAVVADREEWFEDREFVETLFARLESTDGAPEIGAQRLARAANSLQGADLFAFNQVRLERVKILKAHNLEVAKAEIAALASESAHLDFALAAEIGRLSAELLQDAIVPQPSV